MRVDYLATSRDGPLLRIFGTDRDVAERLVRLFDDLASGARTEGALAEVPGVATPLDVRLRATTGRAWTGLRRDPDDGGFHRRPKPYDRETVSDFATSLVAKWRTGTFAYLCGENGFSVDVVECEFLMTVDARGAR